MMNRLFDGAEERKAGKGNHGFSMERPCDSAKLCPFTRASGNRKHEGAVIALALFELDVKALDHMYHEVRGHL